MQEKIKIAKRFGCKILVVLAILVILAETAVIAYGYSAYKLGKDVQNQAVSTYLKK